MSLPRPVVLSGRSSFLRNLSFCLLAATVGVACSDTESTTDTKVVERLEAAGTQSASTGGSIICANYGDGYGEGQEYDTGPDNSMTNRCTACVQQSNGTWLPTRGCYTTDSAGVPWPLTPCSQVVGVSNQLTYPETNGDTSAYDICVADPFWQSYAQGSLQQQRPDRSLRRQRRRKHHAHAAEALGYDRHQRGEAPEVESKARGWAVARPRPRRRSPPSILGRAISRATSAIQRSWASCRGTR